MKTKLITDLRTAANALENGTFAYNWIKPESCNCGVVACAIMGQSIDGMKALLAPMRAKVERPNWNILVQHFCPVTGMPENLVFRALAEAGLSQTDIVELEELSNKMVQARMKTAVCKVKIVKPWFVRRLFGATPERLQTGEIDFTNKDNVIRYFRAWADILTEQGQLDAPLTTKQTTNTNNLTK